MNKASLSEQLASMLTSPCRGRELVEAAQNWLNTQRDAIKAQFLASGQPKQMLAAYSDVIDTLLTALYEQAAGKRNPSVVLLAVGGYGRRELFPYSDIDLLFLYKPGHEAEAARIAEFVLYILWDMGLKVGQAHRSVEESLALAKMDVSICTSLLDARRIAGETAIFKQFQERFAKDVTAHNPAEFVEAKMAERDARHRRFGDSRYMLEPNVKEGKGGLRDLHTLWWAARYSYSIADVRELVGLKLLTAEEYRAFEQAQQFLWRVRIHLHYLAERAEERLTFDRQHALAMAMGYEHPLVNRSIARFMRRYFVAVRTVGSITRIFCALLEEGRKRRPRKALGWMWHESWTLGVFLLEGQRLTVRDDVVFERDPALMIELFKVAQLHGLDIHPRALQWIARNLDLIDDTLRSDSRANALFLEILLSEKGPEMALRRMSEAGVLGKFIPDFGRVIGQTQFNMYHVYTVDEHTLFALGILYATENGLLRDELPLATEIIHRIKMRRVLYLALFCHDIAKGRGGDHSTLGEKVAEKLAERFGFSADEIETTAWLVRQHLLFSHTAFKRDLADPKAIHDFVAEVKTPERLKLLLVLTAADIRAVSPIAWNPWKGGLLRELYTRAEQVMGTGELPLRQHEAGQFRSDLLALLPSWEERDVDHYLEQGNPGFWAAFDLPRHAVIARMMKEAQRMELPLLIDTQQHYDRSVTEIVLCTYDQPGLFAKTAGAMALSGANIINAKVFTLKNGMAIDVFQMQDVMGETFDRPDRLAKMSVHLEQILSGEINLAQAFAARAMPFVTASRQALAVPGQVFVDNTASNICSVIELNGRDRPGFLYAVAQAIADLGLTVTTAHISTYGAQAADVFYVKDIFGMKITHDAKLRQIRDTLLKVINDAG